jgi:hypothetical protein
MPPSPASLTDRMAAALTPNGLLRRLSRLALDAVAFTLTAAAVTGFIISMGRREIARDLILLYLQGQGIEAQVEIDRLDGGGVSGRISLGPAAKPDLSIDNFEIGFVPSLASSGQTQGLMIGSVRLWRPRIVLQLKEGQIDLVPLRRLINALPKPAAPSQAAQVFAPAIAIDGGKITLETPAGPVTVLLSAGLTGQHLDRLDGQILPFTLRREDSLVRSGGGAILVRPRGDQLRASISLEVPEMVNDGLGLEDARLDLEADLPDLGKSAADAPLPVHLTGALMSGAISHAGLVAQGAELNLRFDGTLLGAAGTDVRRDHVRGRLTGLGRLQVLSADGLEGRGARITLDAPDLVLSARSGSSLSGPALRASLGLDQVVLGKTYLAATNAQVTLTDLRLNQSQGQIAASAKTRLILAAERVVQGPLSLRQMQLSVEAPDLGYQSVDDVGVWNRTALTGNLAAQAARYELAGAALPGAVQSGPRAFELADIGADFSGQGQWNPDGPILALMVSAKARDGMDQRAAHNLLAADPASPLGDQTKVLEAGLSDFQLTLRNGALTLGPQGDKLALTAPLQIRSPSGLGVDFAARRNVAVWSSRPDAGVSGGFDLALTLGKDQTVRLSVPVWSQDLANNLAITGALKTDLSGPKLDLHASANGQLRRLEDGSFRLVSRLDLANVDLVQQELGLKSGMIELDLSGDAKGLTAAELVLTKMQAVDLAAQRRFEVMSLKGQANLALGVWRSRVAATTQSGHALGAVSFKHYLASGQGDAVIEAKDLVFAKSGLQPKDISPLARFMSQTKGSAGFSGRFDWTRSGTTSRGAVTIKDLDFQTPVGSVDKAYMSLNLTSLAPLTTSAGQTIGAKSVGISPPLTNINGLFALHPDAVIMQVGAADWAGGRIWLEPTQMAFDQTKGFSGSVILDGVDLGQILAASPLADQVKITALVDGTLPFEVKNGAIKITGGKMAARGAGRLSIARTALGGVQTAGGTASAAGTPGQVAPAGTNAIQDFAYQAMENLAFETLDAHVESREGSRLGMVFHIKGQNDPAKDVPAKIALRDLVAGRAFDRPIPLPKGTPIDLTLDTSLNFGDLIAAIQDALRRRIGDEAAEPQRSAPVQP